MGGPLLHLGSGEGSRRGSAAVRRLQRGLDRAGYAPGPVDGRYGPLTAAAVERFQANHALRVDGIVGPATRQALRAAPLLTLGAGTGGHASPAVARLQRRLRHAGFAPGPIDGRLGPRTEDAILNFQHAHHLTVDGVAGPATRRALRAHRRVSHVRARHHHGRPLRSAPVVNVPQPKLSPTPRPAQVEEPSTPALPLLSVLILLGVVGVAAVAIGYFQQPVVARAGQVTQTAGRKRRARTTPEPEPDPPAVRFVIYEDNGGGYYWTITSATGEVLARSAEFATYEEANQAAGIVHRGAATASFERGSSTSPRPARPAWPQGSAESPGGRRR